VKKIHAFFLFLFFYHVAVAQNSSMWFSVQAPFRKGNLEWHNDGGYRTYGFDARASQWLYRTGIRYYASTHFNAAGGYALFSSRAQKDKPDFGVENRLWGEVVLQHSISEVQVIQRLRIEQRWFDATSAFARFQAQRYRYRLGMIKKISSKSDIQLYNEIMLQTRESALGYNQNRLGMFWHFRPKQNQINLGYTYLHQKNNPTHLIMLGYQFINQTTSGNRKVIRHD